MKTVQDFEGDYYEMARAVLAAGADEIDGQMTVQDWLAYGDLHNETVEQLAMQYNEEHATWRSVD